MPLGVKTEPPVLTAHVVGSLQHNSFANIKCQLGTFVMLGPAGGGGNILITMEELVSLHHPPEDTFGDARRTRLGRGAIGSHVVGSKVSCNVVVLEQLSSRLADQ